MNRVGSASMLALCVTALATGCIVDRSGISGGTDAGFDAPFADAPRPDAPGLDAPVDAYVPPPIDAPGLDSPDAFVDPDAYVLPDAYLEPDAFVDPDAYVLPDAFVPECSGTETRCTGNVLDRCASGRYARDTDCGAIGCGVSLRDPSPHCLRLVPSNVPPDEMRGGPDVTLSAPAVTVDTTACDGASSGIAAGAFRVVGALCVLSVGTLTLDASSQLNITGTRPLVLVATGDVTLSGSVAVAGFWSVASGAGESAEGAGEAGRSDGANDGGGGGGSFCGGGGAGGGAGGTAVGGAAGAVVGSTTLVPLRGGSPGGDGSGTMALRALGGRGGGAIQISSRGRITVSRAIVVTGGGGEGGRRSGSSASAGSGGGSGGAVLLEAVELVLPGGHRIDLRGGAGASGACFDGSFAADELGSRGQNGYEGAAASRPAGGAAPVCEGGGAFTGGFGGDASGAGQAAALVGGPADNAGGGGGGAGCLVMRATNVGAVTAATEPAVSSVVSTAAPLVD